MSTQSAFDLNILLPEAEPKSACQTLRQAAKALGYQGIVWNHVIMCQEAVNIKPLVVSSPRSSPLAMLLEYTRVTIIIHNDDELKLVSSKLWKQILQQYQLVAVEVTLFSVAIKVLQNLQLSILTIQNITSSPLPTPKQVQTLKRLLHTKNVYLELTYSACFHSSLDRSTLLREGHFLTTHFASRLILSSGARQASELRAPKDLTHLTSLFDGKFHKSYLYLNPSRLLSKVFHLPFLGEIPTHRPALKLCVPSLQTSELRFQQTGLTLTNVKSQKRRRQHWQQTSKNKKPRSGVG